MNIMVYMYKSKPVLFLIVDQKEKKSKLKLKKNNK